MVSFVPRVGTFGQIEIDQVLAGNPGLFGQDLEVGDCILVETERHLLFEAFAVRIPDGVREIVFFSHRNFPYWLRSFRVALRAEMILTSVSSCL